MSKCTDFSNSVYDRVRKRPEIQGRVIFPAKDRDNFCFRLELVLPAEVVAERGRYGLSVSIPPDACGNRGSRFGEGFPSTIETALIKIAKGETLTNRSSAGIVYNDSCGYYDVLRPDGIDGLVEEIVRIADFLASPDFRENEPEQYDDYEEYEEESDDRSQSDAAVDASSDVPVEEHPLKEGD